MRLLNLRLSRRPTFTRTAASDRTGTGPEPEPEPDRTGTELCVAWRANGRSVSAGQIDALYIDKDGQYYILDFKRVKSKHKLDPNEKGFCLPGEDPACALPPLAHLPDTHLQKYSLQTSIYNLMLHQTHGIDAGKNMYLLRMHTDRVELIKKRNAKLKRGAPPLPEYELVPCLDLRAEARDVLRLEEERLAAKPPPPPPAAPAGAPTAAGESPPPQGAAAVHKRPRGNHPKGKDWDAEKGDWVKRPRGQAAPVADLTVNVKPRGRPPKGKRWDDQAGCYRACGAAQSKRKAPQLPADSENSSPQVQRVHSRR